MMIAALAVNIATVLTVPLWRPNQFWLQSLVRWEELRPGQPTSPPSAGSLTLFRDRPGRAGRVMLGLSQIQVHTAFLADAIRFYVDHPERRAAIGTQAEYDHLMHALGVVPLPSQAVSSRFNAASRYRY